MLKVAGTDQSAGDLYTAITAIGIVGTQVAYTASSLSVTKGDQDIVTLSNAASHDDTYIEIGEISGGAGGFDFEFTKATSETTEIPAELHVSGFYNGSTAHYVQVYIWNYSLAVPAYELAGIMNTRSAEYDYTFPLTVDNHNASTGEMKVRFLHVGTTGNNSHYIRINLLQWDKQVTDSETASAIAAIKAKTDRLQFTTADNVKADADTIKTQAVTCDAAVTVLASVGTAATSTAQTGDAFARLGAPAGASVSADIAALPTAAEVSAQVMADFSEQNYVYYVFGAP
jgi:hypothetical protein